MTSSKDKRWRWAAAAAAGAMLLVGAAIVWRSQAYRAAPAAGPTTTAASTGTGAGSGTAAPGDAASANHAGAAAPREEILVAVGPPACNFQPLLPASSPSDGSFDLQAALSRADRPDASAYLSVARESAQDRRARDAEVALIVACRQAASSAASPSVPLADVQGVLGQLYAQAALGGRASDVHAEALQRARQLLGESAAAYAAILGQQSSKTTLAQSRLAALERGQAEAADEPSSRAATAGGTAAMGASRASPRQEEEAVAGSRRRAPADRTVAADADLSQMDQDLRRLRAQAGAVTRDPEGFNRRMAQAEAERNACADRACLQRWYAQRRSQLLDEF